jgi:hypothetical protein
MLSVRDIQGQWREKNAQNIWIVSGIVVERAKRIKAQKKPIVLSDGPNGVEWGNGNLKGNFEDGCLVWRNRRGEIAYCWTKFDSSSEVPTAQPMMEIQKERNARRTPPMVSPPPVPTKATLPTEKEVTNQDQSPRSTDSSANSIETAAITGGVGSMVLNASHGQVEGKPDDIAVAEMKMLVEMAGNRLMAGDVYMSMRYITLAQQVQPLISLGGDAQQQ